MSATIFVLSAIAILLLGTLVIVAVLTIVYGDTSASYRLFAVRDQLIRLDITDDVDVRDPWFNHTYKQVNALLQCSYMLSGTSGWIVADEAGKRFAERRFRVREKADREDEQDVTNLEARPPEALLPVLKEIDEALDQLLDTHVGWIFLLNSATRKYRKLYKQRARKLDDTIHRGLQLAH